MTTSRPKKAISTVFLISICILQVATYAFCQNLPAAAAKTPESFLSRQPNPLLLYLTVLVSFVTLAWKVMEFIIARKDRNKDRNLSIEDEFWFRQVLLPICIQPLQKFALTQAEEINALESKSKKQGLKDKNGPYRDFLKLFKHEKNTLLSQFMVLGPISQELYRSVTETLDDLEDYVTEYCAFNSLGKDVISETQYSDYSNPKQTLFIKIGEIILTLSKKHKDLFR